MAQVNWQGKAFFKGYVRDPVRTPGRPGRRFGLHGH
jgi:hypothetical protein